MSQARRSSLPELELSRWTDSTPYHVRKLLLNLWFDGSVEWEAGWDVSSPSGRIPDLN